MINIPLPFFVMWAVLLLGVLTSMLVKIKNITDATPDDVQWKMVIRKFFNKEWPSYGISFILTFVIAGSFQYIKRFDVSSNQEISKYAKWIPLAVPALYIGGYLCQGGFYKLLGRIQGKTGINADQFKPAQTVVIDTPEATTTITEEKKTKDK